MTGHISDVNAAILAGGLGTRLRSRVADGPKALATIQGRPFLEYPLDQLAAAGVRSVVLCTGYLGEQVKSFFGESYRTFRLLYSQESSLMGTAGALRLALPLLKSETILVMNGDSYCQTSLNELWGWHCRRGADATLLLTKMSNTKRYGRVRVDGEDRILQFDEKGSSRGSGWINAGIYLIKRQLLDEIPAERAVSLEREVFPAWIGRGLYGYRAVARFIDIGTPESYAFAERFFAG